MNRATCLFWLGGTLLSLAVAVQGVNNSLVDQCTASSKPCKNAEETPTQRHSKVTERNKDRNKLPPLVTASAQSPSSSEPDLVTLEVIPNVDNSRETSSPQHGGQGRPINNQQSPSDSTAQDSADSDGVSLLDIIEEHAEEPEAEEPDSDSYPERVNLESISQTGSEPPSGSRVGNLPGGNNPGGVPGGRQGGNIQGGIPGGNIQGGVPGGPQGGNIQGGIPGGNIQGGIPGGRQGGNIQGGIPGGNIQGGIPGGPQGGNIQGGIPGGNIQGGIPGGPQGGNIQGGVPGGNIQGGAPGGTQGGLRTGPTFVDGNSTGSIQGSLPGGAPQGDVPPSIPIALNLTAEPINAPPPGKDAEFFGHTNADLCSCTDAVPSGAFNCMQVRFQNECETPAILNGPSDVPEGFCQITCGRCDCCTDMLTMSSRRGLDTFRRLFQTMADAQGSRSIGRSLQNPSFTTTVFAPTNDAFARMLHAINMTVDGFLQQPTLMNQVMSYHVLLGPTAASSEELATGFLGTTLPTVNAAAFISVNASGPVLEVGGIGSYASVIIPNVYACRSIFHVIDEVLLPFSPEGLQG